MTRAMPGATTDLLKVPAYGFYELPRLLGERVLPVGTGAEYLFPDADLYHPATAGDDRIAVLLTYYPDPAVADPLPRAIDYAVSGIPWPRVNVARFQIDAERSNGYTAAGGDTGNPYPVSEPDRLPEIRRAQEIALDRPIARDVPVSDGIYRETVTLAPYTTSLLWITPTGDDVPATPRWLETTVEGGNVVLRWTPNREPWFFSYDLFVLRDGEPVERLSPDPLRAALWVDTAPPPGPRTYAVRAVSASGVAGELATSDDVVVPPGNER